MFVVFVSVAVYCCFLCCIVPLAAKDKKKKKKDKEGPYSVHTFKEKGDGDDINDDDTYYEDEDDNSNNNSSNNNNTGRSLYEAQRDFVEQLYMRRSDGVDLVTAEAVIADRLLEGDINDEDLDAVTIIIIIIVVIVVIVIVVVIDQDSYGRV